MGWGASAGCQNKGEGVENCLNTLGEGAVGSGENSYRGGGGVVWVKP